MPPLIILLTIVLSLGKSIPPTDALKCYCNVCPTDTCETAIDNDSACYKSVERSYNRENETYSFDPSFGCISGGEGLLAHLQCHTSSLKHIEPTFVTCCKDADFCNGDLPDPSEEDDPRWKFSEPSTLKFKNVPLIGFLAFLSLSVLLVLGTCYLAFLLTKSCFASTDKTLATRDSTCSSKADLEKFNQHFAGSSASTHSYSISDSIPNKSGPVQTVEASCTTVDLTSGHGERVLNQRTIARAVALGPLVHIGNGRFGRVLKGQYKGDDVAVKAFRPFDYESWKREDKIFEYLSHENIVRFLASDVVSVGNSETELWMILEYCPYGSLCDYLDHNEIKSEQQAVKMLYSIINGLNYLHEDFGLTSRRYKPAIAHRDIKSKNILMKSPDYCCIADFGHALFKLDENMLDFGNYQNLQVGTVRYMAPEILRPNKNLNYSDFITFAQADLYQFGLILWEVCYRTALHPHPAGNHKLPYDGVVPQNPKIEDMDKIVCEGQYRPPRCDKWAKYPLMSRMTNLMVECWRPNPKSRMETLGVKKKFKEMYINDSRQHQYHHYIIDDLSFRIDRDKTRSSDVTL